MILHSLLGSATLGTFLALIVTIRVYPPLVSRLFHVDKKKVESKCKLSFTHVLLDVTNHPHNPLFWPFRSAIETSSPIYFALGNPLGSLWMQIIMAVLLAALIVIKWKNLFEELVVG